VFTRQQRRAVSMMTSTDLLIRGTIALALMLLNKPQCKPEVAGDFGSLELHMPNLKGIRIARLDWIPKK
jgi:hypothetical protein